MKNINRIYMQGLVPDAEEQLELIAMTTQLLNSVPAEDDLFFIDKYQRPGMTNSQSHVKVIVGSLRIK